MPVKKVTPKKAVEEETPEAEVENVAEESAENSESVEEKVAKLDSEVEELSQKVEELESKTEENADDTATVEPVSAPETEVTSEVSAEDDATPASEHWGNPPSDNGSKKIILFIVIIIITMLVASGGLFAWNKYGSELVAKPTPTEAPEEPAPTEVEVDVSKFSIKVLNGSGTAGVAATVEKLLDEEGFNVDSIGNADEDNLEETTIAVKEEVDEEYVDKLREVLSEDYEVADKIDELDEEEDVDVIVTVGKN